MKIGLAGLIVGLTATLAIGVAACGGDNGDEVRTVTVPAVEQDAHAGVTAKGPVLCNRVVIRHAQEVEPELTGVVGPLQAK